MVEATLPGCDVGLYDIKGGGVRPPAGARLRAAASGRPRRSLTWLSYPGAPVDGPPSPGGAGPVELA
jgi:hypothetical protein